MRVFWIACEAPQQQHQQHQGRGDSSRRRSATHDSRRRQPLCHPHPLNLTKVSVK